MNIGFIGLGKLGLPCALAVESRGHKVVGDRVTVDINPNDVTKTKDYYVRKRLYQEAVLVPPKNKSTINSTGIGRFEILNGGADYTAGTYTGVAFTSGSGTGATATFTVSDAGVISNIQLQDTGSGYE